MPYGSPGGEVQTQAMLQFLVNHLDRGMDLQQAIEEPRFASYATPATESPHVAQKNLLRIEDRVPDSVRGELAARGHQVAPWPSYCALAGAVCAVRLDHASGIIAGGADPRRLSYAIGW
jgi:gamma-glutamyltranspeptidase/glutathione hydrolase